MLRFVGAGLVVALAATLALAAETHGTVKKVDAEGGTLTVAVKSGKETTEKEFTIGDATKFVVHEADDKRQWTGKKGLKDEAVRKGREAVVTTDPDGKVVHVRVGVAREWAHGTFKKANPDAGTLTVAIKGKETTDKEFTVTEHTKLVVYDGKDRKELTGKAALKDDAVVNAKEGVEVAVATEEGGKLIRVRIGALPKKDGKKKDDPKKEDPKKDEK